MDTNLLISVIIPVYNSSPYLEACINSIIEQTIFDKLEIILVDDGSTDSSIEICNRYANAYQNIVVIAQENMGVSVARNTGLKYAKGKYIYFCDSDDLANKQLLEILLNNINKYNADLSIVDFQRIFPDGSKKKYRKNQMILFDNNNDIIKSFLSSSLIGNNLFDKLFSYNLIDDLRFPANYKVGEDMFFIYNVLKKCNKVIIDSHNALYNYIIRSESAMNSTNTSKYDDAFELSKKIYKELSNNQKLEIYAYGHLAHEECKSIEYKLKNSSNKKNINTEYKSKLKKYSILKIIKCLNGKHLYGFLLMRFSPSLYMIIHKILKIG